MSTILTDDERPNLPDGTHPQSLLVQMLSKYAIEWEAAVLAKLAQQVPVAWLARRPNGDSCAFETDDPDLELARTDQTAIFQPLYTHPAPQQADRQRVPEGWKLVPVEPTCDMLAAMSGEWHRSRHGKAREQYAAMLAAAPEQPAPQPLTDDLKSRCAEILYWQKTGFLSGDALRNYAERHYPDEALKMQMAESDTAREAFRFICGITKEQP